MTRRTFVPLLAQAPAVITAERLRPVLTGCMVGDPMPGRAMLWARADRAARLIVEVAATEGFRNARRLAGPICGAASDFTARLDLPGLPAGETVFYRVRLQDAGDPRRVSEPVVGRFRSAPSRNGRVRFLWSGDTVGQGYGINPDWGGLRTYETMRRREPDFFLHSGDTIYADGPLQTEMKLADGSTWRNVVTEEKSKVAETLNEFRGNYRYNLLDDHVRRFNAEVAQVWQWDDHEVLNNWSPSKDLSKDEKYEEKRIATLAARARQAFLEYAPIRLGPSSEPRIYRRIPYGPLLDVFVIDTRTYRGPNTHNRQEQESGDTTYLGRPQLAWLQRGLTSSTALWKVVACDMPVGLQVGDGGDEQGRPRFEASANGNGPALGRELELARLLRELQRRRVRNVVWLTADTHYTAAHYYDPAKADFKEFDPFWEFVSGPLHAGTFGPNAPDDTFGLQVKYEKAPPKGQANLPPSAGMQFFGEVEIEGVGGAMTVTLRDLAGTGLFTQRLEPA